MKTTWIALLALALYSTWTRGQVPLVQEPAKRTAVKDIVDIELLTHTEIHDKIHKEGKTAVLIVNGGTEQRGPQNVLGGHTLMGHMKAIAIAKKLGNALVAPSLPYATSPNGLSEATPGGVGLPSEIFKAVKTAEVESMATNGFKTIFLMGDHGGGQAEMEQVARDEDRKLSARGVRFRRLRARSRDQRLRLSRRVPGKLKGSRVAAWIATDLQRGLREVALVEPHSPMPGSR
jgi:hypothetical protein